MNRQRRQRVAVSACAPAIHAVARMALLILALVLALATIALGQGPLPEGVPDVLSPGTRDDWRAFHVGNAEDDPNFPLIMFVNTAGHQPTAVLMAVNAQNGTDRWSLESDPVVLIALFAHPPTIARVYYDTGFAQEGRATGQYAVLQDPEPEVVGSLMRSGMAARQQAPEDRSAPRQPSAAAEWPAAGEVE
ncbi:MAG: hypothetical protein ACE147_05855 [Candidatus Methylomirabilales bacterium]